MLNHCVKPNILKVTDSGCKTAANSNKTCVCGCKSCVFKNNIYTFTYSGFKTAANMETKHACEHIAVTKPLPAQKT